MALLVDLRTDVFVFVVVVSVVAKDVIADVVVYSAVSPYTLAINTANNSNTFMWVILFIIGAVICV